MTNPATCRLAITPYIAISLARSWAVIAVKECRSSCPMRGDLDALAAAPRPGMLSGRMFISVAGVCQRDAEREPRRAAPLHQRRHLVPVDIAGGSFGHGPVQ